MGCNSNYSGSNKAVIWIVVGIVGAMTFFGAMFLVMGILAYRSKGTGDIAKSTTTPTKTGPVTKVEGPKETGIDVGNIAIDIVGVDFDGNGFKLSDYRDKVVMLDFWGFW